MSEITSQKIDAYAKANLQSLKKEEAKTGRKMTKFDIAQYMLRHGKLNKNEYANWMNTQEGFNAQTLSKQQMQALKQGSVWGFAGYGGGEESYLESLTSFSQKNPVENQNEISGYHMKLNKTVEERKKKSDRKKKHIEEQRVTNQVLNPNQALKEQKFKDHINSLPEIDATYTELMNDIRFQKMTRNEKTEYLLKITGQKFDNARVQGDKKAMKKYLSYGCSLAFEIIDQRLGIRDFKELVKKYTGINMLIESIDKYVDDGDDNNNNFKEEIWSIIKRLGKYGDSLIGTKGFVYYEFIK